jgi:hypothetical protein
MIFPALPENTRLFGTFAGKFPVYSNHRRAYFGATIFVLW